MRNSFILLGIALSIWNVVATDPFQKDLNHNWENFKKTFNKKYELDEEDGRRLIWEQNVKKIMKHNVDHDMGRHTYQLGINKYSDMTREERLGYMTGLIVPPEIPDTGESRNFNFFSVPDSVDWRQKGAVTPVKDQGQCGSCWAFSSTGTLEGVHQIRTGNLVSLSEQNLIDCSSAFGNHGCSGGFPSAALLYIISNGGIDTEESYPYEGKENICRFQSTTIGATAMGFAILLPEGNETILQFAVFASGPISVSINASLETFLSYKGGIYNDPNCDGRQVINLNHAVLVVGYGSENGQDFWIVKNSWGTSWGEQGYIRMARNQGNVCGIATYLTFPIS